MSLYLSVISPTSLAHASTGSCRVTFVVVQAGTSALSDHEVQNLAHSGYNLDLELQGRELSRILDVASITLGPNEALELGLRMASMSSCTFKYQA